MAEQLAHQMDQCWQAGERPRAEEYLRRHPELNENSEAAIRLICEEICLGEEHGCPVAAQEVLDRFPRWRKQLEVVLDCQRLLRPEAGGPHFPTSGEKFGDFLLIAELGRGVQGRVFLASQPALADRPVVLKLSARFGHEHLALARLQHTHIVPLYLAEDDTQRQLRLLCMPYYGGASLASVLENLQDTPVRQRTGMDLLGVVDDLQLGVLLAPPTDGPARRFFSRASYVQAICWIGACLADALHYAHERGLLHLDMKPANVLLAADGQPMLLDFHLARQPLTGDGAMPEWFGGTPGYMSPEQKAALNELTQGRQPSEGVDRRSDIYSLGLSLFETLAGRLPPVSDKPADLSAHNPAVSAGLADIIRKCLEAKPADRYPDAAALADDLRRHLADLPLSGVDNRSWGERWRKWRRRSPHTLRVLILWGVILSLLAGAGTFLSFEYGRQLRQAEQALADSQEQLAGRNHAEAIRSLERGLEQAHALPGQGQLVLALERQLHAARQARLRQEVGDLANHVRFLADGDGLALQRLQMLDNACRVVWEARAQLDWNQAALAKESLRADFLDLTMIGAELRVRLTPPAQAAQARREALKMLVEAETLAGAGAALFREQQYHAELLGIHDFAQTAAGRAGLHAPHSAWEHYALGRALQRQGKLAEAKGQLDRAVFLQPDGFWPSFYQGTCAYRLGHYDEAVAAFRACLALAPAKAECYYNRGLAYQALGQLERARRDYDRALELDPGQLLALLNRGIVHYREKRYGAALIDLEEALGSVREPAPVYYQLALTHSALKDKAAARKCAAKALEHRPGYKEAELLLQQLR